MSFAWHGSQAQLMQDAAIKQQMDMQREQQFQRQLALAQAGGGGGGGGGGASNGPSVAGADASLTQANSQMQAYLSQAAPTRAANPFSAPTMSNTNRFEAGLAANEGRLNALLEDPSSIQQTAAYKFRVGQGQEALNRQQAAKGMAGSGNRLMELTKYGQDMASQEYDNQFGRLSGLVKDYSSSWLGDKNANTQQFSALSNAYLGGENANTARYAAESDAWGKRGGLLSDLVGTHSRAAAQNFSSGGGGGSSGGAAPVTVSGGGFRLMRGGGTGTFA